MASLDFNVDIQLGNAYQELGKLESQFEDVRRKMQRPLQIDAKGNVTDVVKNVSNSFAQTTKEAKRLESEIKQAMASIIVAGGKGTKEFNQLEQELKQATAATKQLDDAMEQVEAQTKQVGNSGGKFKEVFGQLSGGLFLGGGIAAGIEGLRMLGRGMAEIIEIGTGFETALADLSAITGVTGIDLENFGEDAQNLAAQFGGSAIDQIETFKGILSRLGPDIAKSPEALNSMTESINTMAKAAGIDATTSMQSLTTAMLQFGVDLSDPVKAAEEMALMMNVMAAGSKEGSAEIPQIAEALEVAGAMAKGANVSFEETNAAIQVLATRGKVGAEAGTALRNVMGILGKGRFLPKDTLDELKAAGVNTDTLADKSLTLSERLRALAPIMKDDALVAKLFGAENIVAGRALLDQTDALDKFTQKLTGTNTAYDQAGTNMQTFVQRMDRFKAQLQNIAIDIFTGLQPIITSVASFMGDLLPPLIEGIKSAFSILWNAVSPIFKLIGEIIVELQTMFGVVGKGQSVGKTFGDVLGFVAQAAATLVGYIIRLNTAILTVFLWLYKQGLSIINAIGKAFNELAASGGVVGSVVNWIGGAFKSLVGWVSGAIKSILQFIGLLDEEPKVAPFSKAAKEASILKDEVGAIPDVVINADESIEKFGETTTKVAQTLPTLEEQLKAVNEQLVKMAANGDANTDKFRELVKEAEVLQKKLSNQKFAIEVVKLNLDSGLLADEIAQEFNQAFDVVTLNEVDFSVLEKQFYEEYNAMVLRLKEQKRELNIFDKDNLKLALQKALDAGEINTEEFERQLQAIDLGFQVKAEIKPEIETNVFDNLFTDDALLSGVEKLATDIGSIFTDLFKTETNATKDQTEELEKEYGKQNELLKAKLDANQLSYTEYKESLAEADEELQKQQEKSGEESVSLAEKVALSGVQVAVEAVKKMIPIWLVKIWGDSLSQYNIAGVAVAAGLTAILTGLTSALGAEEGYNPGSSKGYGKRGASDTVPIWVNPSEDIFTASVSNQERDLFNYLHAGGTSVEYFNKYYVKELLNTNTINNKDVFNNKDTSVFRDISNTINNKELFNNISNNGVFNTSETFNNKDVFNNKEISDYKKISSYKDINNKDVFNNKEISDYKKISSYKDINTKDVFNNKDTSVFNNTSALYNYKDATKLSEKYITEALNTISDKEWYKIFDNKEAYNTSNSKELFSTFDNKELFNTSSKATTEQILILPKFIDTKHFMDTHITKIDNGTISELRGLREDLKKAKLINTYHNNKIIIDDNRKVRVQQLAWSGR